MNNSITAELPRISFGDARNCRTDETTASRQVIAIHKSSENTKPYEWILHPVLDLLFCCGGLVWIFFALHYFGFGPQNISKPVQIMLSLAALGAIGLSETHIMATLFRVYKGKAKEKFAPRSSLMALACVLLALAGVLAPTLVPIFLKVYLLFVAQHFTAQTFGLTLLYCAKRSYFMNELERKVLAALLQSTMWVAILRQLTYREWSGTEILGLKLPFWGALPQWICQSAEIATTLSALALLVLLIRKWKCEGKVFPLPAFLMTLSGVAVFLAGKDISQTLWIYVPAFYHGSQYIAVSLAVYLKEKGLPEGMSTRQIGELVTEPVALKYLGLLFAGALLFFQIMPYIAGFIGLNSAAFAASSFACIHFHHFLTDRAVWKLRDADTRKLLVA